MGVGSKRGVVDSFSDASSDDAGLHADEMLTILRQKGKDDVADAVALLADELECLSDGEMEEITQRALAIKVRGQLNSTRFLQKHV